MRRKFQYLILLITIATAQVSAQTEESLLKPFVLREEKPAPGSKQQVTVLQSYAVKGTPPDRGKVLRRLSDSIFIVRFHSPEEMAGLQKNAKIRMPVNDLWKLSPSLLDQLSAQLLQQGTNAKFLVTVSDTGSFAKRYGNEKRIQVRATYPSANSLLVYAPAGWIRQSALPDTNITYIGIARTPFTERELAGFDLSANCVNLAQRVWPSVNGTGMTLSIKEDRMDTADIDISGRYLFSPSASTLVQTHATTMATIAAGAGNTYYTGKGVATAAMVSSSDFANLLPDNNQQLQQSNISVQNHSYGVGIENYYGADAAAHDAQVYQNPSLVHVFSAGNAGMQASASGTYSGISGYANLTGSFKMAKNILTVGATDSFANNSPFSSRGPAYDGRVKPELVAFGEDGSSGAAALVSGMAVLVQDAWKQKNNALPDAALTRAVLINSADDAGPPGIDFSTGYGVANAWRAIQTVQQNRIWQGHVQNNQTVFFPISVPANAVNLKITLCWTDPPAQANSYKALVNDLDLSVTNSSNSENWLPWVLNSKPAKDSLQQLPARKRDSLNNTEQVSIMNPSAGIYQLTVNGFSVTGSASQAFTIAWQYDTLGSFLFTYPVKTDNLFPLQKHNIRWQTTLSGTGTLEYRMNNQNWQTIATNIDLARNFYPWYTPDTLGIIQFRMVKAGSEWRTDTVSLSPSLRATTGFNCLDSFLIYWQRAAVDSYRVYRLGPRYLEPFAVVTDTVLLQAKQNNTYTYFTIAPLLPFRTEGARGYTFNYTRQQADCYINGFIADPFGTTHAKLSLLLGSLYHVTKIVFEKLTANGFIPLTAISPVTSKQQISTEPANSGLNTYRARIELQNGQVYYTRPEQVLQFADRPYYVFPNPLVSGTVLRVLAEDTDDTVFSLFDVYGRKLAEQKITGFLNEIRLPLLQKGVYYYTIVKAGIRQLSQALLVL